MGNQAKTNAELLKEIVSLQKKIKKLEKTEATVKLADATLRESEARYRNIIETIQDGYFEINLNGRYTFVNDVICKYLQYSRKKLIGMDPLLYQTPEKYEKYSKIFNKVYKTGKPVKSLEMEVIRKDGTIQISEVSISLTKNAKGEPSGFRGISRDITERKKMEDAIRQSEEKYRTIIETIQDGYMEMDLAGNYIFMNDVVCGHLQYRQEELTGQNYGKFLTQESAQTTLRAFSEVYKTGIPLKSFEMEGLRKDGTTGFYDLSVSLMKDARGKPIGFRSISRDITERKQMEKTLRETNRELLLKIEENEALQVQLKEQAIRDPLTGLFNRRFLEETLSRELAQAERGKEPMSLAIIDLDRFKNINDTYGHDVGDLFLMALGDLLEQKTRAGDVACRYGGEEFILIMPGAPLACAAVRINEFREEFSALKITINNKDIGVTFSAGLAEYPFHGLDGKSIIAVADKALYAAKEAGRNRLVMAPKD